MKPRRNQNYRDSPLVLDHGQKNQTLQHRQSQFVPIHLQLRTSWSTLKKSGPLFQLVEAAVNFLHLLVDLGPIECFNGSRNWQDPHYALVMDLENGTLLFFLEGLHLRT